MRFPMRSELDLTCGSEKPKTVKFKMHLPPELNLELMSLVPMRAAHERFARDGNGEVNRTPTVLYGTVSIDLAADQEVEIEGSELFAKGLTVLSFCDGSGKWHYYDRDGVEMSWAEVAAAYREKFGPDEQLPIEPPDSKDAVEALVEGSGDRVVTETRIELKGEAS